MLHWLVMWVTLIVSLQCNVLLGSLRAWQSCGCLLTQITHPNTFVDKVHPLIAKTLYHGSDPPSRTMLPAAPQKLLRKGVKSNPWRPQPQNIYPGYNHYKRPDDRHLRTPPEVLWPCKLDMLKQRREDWHFSTLFASHSQKSQLYVNLDTLLNFVLWQRSG